MRKPPGRNGRSRSSSIALGVGLLAGLYACGSDGASGRGGPWSATGLSQAALSVEVAEAPASVAFQLDLDGQRFELVLQRTAPPTTPDYQSFRRTREGVLIPLPPPNLDCTYRGAAEALGNGASGAGAGFAAMSVCTSATGHSAGAAASGVLRAGGRFWRLTPDVADTDASDGIRHFAEPLRRGDAPAGTAEPALETTLYRLPESPAPRLEFREGTDEETKYIDLVVVNDAARVAELEEGTQATTLQFVDTMNALLETSGLSPRLRVTLRAQVLFDEDPYTPEQVGDEVDNDSLLDEFLDWGEAEEDLPPHDERLLLSGHDFVGGVVGYAGLGVACSSNANGFIVQAGDASGGFAVLSAVHELGHTLGMNHDDGSRRECPSQGFIMAAVGCGNCPVADSARFSPCSIEQFQDYLAGPAYAGLRCADDVPTGAGRSCGDGAVQDGETCDCGSEDCADIDPCCDGAICQLREGAECSDFNDGCCRSCAVVTAEDNVVCRPERSVCDIAEVCSGATKACPPDSFEAAGATCTDERDNAGVCYLGDCRSRATQCEQIAEQQSSAAFDGVTGPAARCGAPCDEVVCSTGQNCLTIGGPGVIDGVSCDDGGQCVDGQCVATIDQCPNDAQKSEPGDCGCGTPDDDDDADGAPDCIDGCPDDADKQLPGACGCGTPDRDADADGSADCVDQCPSDARKSEPGDCGCNALDLDSDGDGAADCIDECPDDPTRRRAGACGCGVAESDADFDGTPDCVDGCATDPARVAPPCTLAAGTDTDGDGDVDVDNASASPSRSDGGCALPGAPAPSAGSGVGHLGWLALAAIPLWRRRAARLLPVVGGTNFNGKTGRREESTRRADS